MVNINMNNNGWIEAIRKEVEQEQRDYNGPHCCLTMHTELLNATTVLKYSSQYREYGIKVPESTGGVLIAHCMACGKKLPLSLRDEWFHILHQESGLMDPIEDDKDKIPQGFLSDEWWKQRGL